MFDHHASLYSSNAQEPRLRRHCGGNFQNCVPLGCRHIWAPVRIWVRNPAFRCEYSIEDIWLECLTLDISLKTDPCASRNSPTTSCRLLSIESSSPTALVIRPARLFLKLWSMFNSQGEPGARNALYKPRSVSQVGTHWRTDPSYRMQLQDSRGSRPGAQTLLLFRPDHMIE